MFASPGQELNGRRADFLVVVCAAAFHQREFHQRESQEAAGSGSMCTCKRRAKDVHHQNNPTFLHVLRQNIRMAYHHQKAITPGTLNAPWEKQTRGCSNREIRSGDSGFHLRSRTCKRRELGSTDSDEETLMVSREDENRTLTEFGRRLAGLAGGGRRRGPGSGGGLWVLRSLKTRSGFSSGCSRTSSAHLPKKSKTVHIVKYLEAGLALQGKPGAGGLPGRPSQKIDMPYSQELAKWGYDEILGIPRTGIPSRVLPS